MVWPGVAIPVTLSWVSLQFSGGASLGGGRSIHRDPITKRQARFLVWRGEPGGRGLLAWEGNAARMRTSGLGLWPAEASLDPGSLAAGNGGSLPSCSGSRIPRSRLHGGSIKLQLSTGSVLSLIHPSGPAAWTWPASRSLMHQPLPSGHSARGSALQGDKDPSGSEQLPGLERGLYWVVCHFPTSQVRTRPQVSPWGLGKGLPWYGTC